MAANSKNVRRSTILVAVLVGIGLVSLLLMIRRSQPQAASAREGASDQKIEAAISRLTGVRSEMAGRMDEIVKKFYEFSDVVQVKVSELAKNPFEVESFAKDLKTVVVDRFGGPGGPPPAAADAAAGQTLKLLSIMRTSGQGDVLHDQRPDPAAGRHHRGVQNRRDRQQLRHAGLAVG